MEKSNLIRFLATILIFVIGIHCKKEPPVVPPDTPFYKSSVILTVEEIGLNEVWLNVKLLDTLQPRAIQVVRNSVPLLNFSLSAQDTVIVDTTALPQREYLYSALRMQNTIAKDSSASLKAITKDTTTHDFVWTYHTIGYVSSIVRDVAIVNDTLIYAVGKFYEKDTSAGFQIPYNVARWNGKKWELLRVMVETRQIPPTPPHFYYPQEIYGIHIFSTDDIWFATTIEFIRWDGKSEKGTEYIYMLNTPIQSLWGTNPGNVYGAGRSGSVVHYNGSNWTKYDSLTSTTFTDIHGTLDGKEVWFTGWESNGKSVIARYNSGVLKKLYEWGEPTPKDFVKEFVRSLWINENKVYLPSSSGYVYTYSLRTERPSIEKLKLQYFPYSIKGSEANNIFIACEFGMFYHFNGSTWKLFDQFSDGDQSPFGGVEVTKSLVVIGGARYYGIFKSGYVLIGKK